MWLGVVVWAGEGRVGGVAWGSGRGGRDGCGGERGGGRGGGGGGGGGRGWRKKRNTQFDAERRDRIPPTPPPFETLEFSSGVLPLDVYGKR